MWSYVKWSPKKGRTASFEDFAGPMPRIATVLEQGGSQCSILSISEVIVLSIQHLRGETIMLGH